MPWPPPNVTNFSGTVNIATAVIVGTKGSNIYGTAAWIPGATNTDANFSNALKAITNINNMLVNAGITV
jgi:hypothetical protein